jgi:hypothetical protein
MRQILNEILAILFMRLPWIQYIRNRDSSADIGAGYRLDGRGSIPGSGKNFFSSPQRPDRLWGPPSLLSSAYRGALSPVVPRLEREAGHSLPSSAEVKTGGAILPLPYTSQSHIATDGQSVSKSWCQAPSGAHDQIFITV